MSRFSCKHAEKCVCRYPNIDKNALHDAFQSIKMKYFACCFFFERAMERIADYANTIIWYDEAQRFMKCERFCRADESIWDADYKDQMFRLVAYIREKQPLYILMDLRNFFYPVNPEQQQWINEEILPAILATGVRKGAFLLPTDIVAALSIEQIYETEQAASLPVRMFADYQKALRWLGVWE